MDGLFRCCATVLSCCLCGLSPLAQADEGLSSAVVLQYHHIDDTTPSSTSIHPGKFKEHLDWLIEEGFHILPIADVEMTLRANKKFEHSRNVVLTFDDANVSVCENAWPILKAYQLPFTVFISTESVERNYPAQCSWQQLQLMYESGLMTPANHSHRHGHMISKNFTDGNWREAVLKDIKKAGDLIYEHLGFRPTSFAYPYGEYNDELAQIVADFGLTAYGQHSGAIGPHSDFSRLPRIPASGSYSNLKTLATKLLSLPYKASIEPSTDNPLTLDSMQNPPVLELWPSDRRLLATTRCYDGTGKLLPMTIKQNRLLLKNEQRLPAGRHRYTCTAPSKQRGRFYWLSYQWLVEDV